MHCFPLQILISPILAGLAVGIGVPILLFYVYGVVPVSLCRSGGCGVSTNGSGVRFEFDDENELMGALSGRNTGGNVFGSSEYSESAPRSGLLNSTGSKCYRLAPLRTPALCREL